MMPFADSLDTATHALPAEPLGATGAQAIERLAAQGYEVHYGLAPEFAEAIIAMAREPAIREYCPRDSAERFIDLDSTKRWLAKGRTVFLLLKRADNGGLSLAGYGWAGAATNQHVPAGRSTFALRMGEAGQGQGLATPFAQLIVLAATKLYGAKDMWLETWASNGAAVHIYNKLGAVQVAEKPDRRPTRDGQTVPDTRLYMTLAEPLATP
jgi:RimJ/RimL family protein N-acetyltransferase